MRVRTVLIVLCYELITWKEVHIYIYLMSRVLLTDTPHIYTRMFTVLINTWQNQAKIQPI